MANPILYNGVGSPQSVFSVSSTQHHPVGSRGFLGDGRVYYYAVNTTANTLTRAQLLVAPTFVANHTDQAVTAATDLQAGNSTAIVTIGATAVVADEYKEGWLCVTDGTGEGFMYKIRNHPAHAGSGTFTARLYDPIQVSTAAAATLTLLYNRFRNPQISVTDQLDLLAGVPNVTVSSGSTTSQYFWVQTWGECLLLQDENITTAGQALTIGTGTAGAVEEDDTATTVSQEPIVGYIINGTGAAASIDGEHQPVFLTISQ